MEKIIAGFDGLKYSASTQAHAAWIAKISGAHLVGLFLEDPAYHSYRIYDLISEEGGVMTARKTQLEKKDEKTRASAVSAFESACRKARISCSVHKDRNVALQELLKQSIYADMLVLDRNESLSNHREKPPTHFIHELMGDLQCPVLLVPSRFRRVDRLVMLFDGEPSSVHAIKMLSYTLPALRKNPATVIAVTPQKKGAYLPESKLMKEFMERHYPGCSFIKLKGDPEQMILDYLKEIQGNPLIVLGAYRRSRVSRWFRPSMADLLMRELKFPLFIAHSK